jgi:hypothetical protein
MRKIKGRKRDEERRLVGKSIFDVPRIAGENC